MTPEQKARAWDDGAAKNTEIERLRERLQAIVDWADLALSKPGEFDSHGVKLLSGPVFDDARALLSAK